VLAGAQSYFGDREMQRVGSADVHRVNGRIIDNLAIVRGGAIHRKCVRELASLFERRARHRLNLD